ncbi:MAG TPA: HPr family phosphocarrier protein [Candidatus Mediterraneibacter norfolkensis]|nr:HPr family phosphocarrier protein [Candidatus Mediterraneibacter norfolkensis]
MNEMNITFKSPDEILEFVNTVSKYEFDMDMKKGRLVVDAKSILGIMNLGLNHVIQLMVYTDDCTDLQEKISKYAA